MFEPRRKPDRSQAAAIFKERARNTCFAFWYRYIRQAGAAGKGICTQHTDTIRNIDLRQAGTVFKDTTQKVLQALGQDDRGQSAAILKSLNFDAGHTIRNDIFSGKAIGAVNERGLVFIV